MILKKEAQQIIESLDQLKQRLARSKDISGEAIQDVDLCDCGINWEEIGLDGTIFLGCKLSKEDAFEIITHGGIIFPKLGRRPYNPYRNKLYTWQELNASIDRDDKSLDLAIYEHFSASRFNPDVSEALNQRIHDHAIDISLRQLVELDDEGMTNRKCVGIMGGHSTTRLDPYYRKVAHTAWLLVRAGYYVCSGGGPGIMEAANLGAYFGGRDLSDLDKAIDILGKAPNYTDSNYNSTAIQVLEEYPGGVESLAIPTWFYGHEPSNLFASHIAKYFSNSIREDTLLAISLYGIVYAPGSAGTTQEIFMDASQNHYATFGWYSPMVFLGKKRYEVDTLIYPLLRQLAHGREYASLLHLTDEPKDVLDFIDRHPPKKLT